MLKHIMSKDEVPTPKGAEILPDKVLTSKTWFFSPKSVMRSQNFLTPQKTQLLMLKHIASKDEAATPKGG